MKYHLHPLILAIIAVFLQPEVARCQDWTGIADLMQGRVLKLEAQQGAVRYRCSGVLIAKERVLTAAHCIPNDQQGTGRAVSVDNKHADVLRWNSVVDLALLKVDGLTDRVIVRRMAPVTIGLPVAAVGFSFGADKPKYVFGHIADIEDKSITAGMYIDAEFIGGVSGGALVDVEGKLISIVQAILSSGQTGLGIVAPVGVVNDFAQAFWPVKP